MKLSLWSLWWNAIDRWSFVAILALMAIGILLIIEASPAVALQHHWAPFLLLKRHFLIFIPGLCLLMSMTFLKQEQLLWMIYAMALFSWISLWVVLGFGPEIKGAKRWISVAGFSLQPSEFLKPSLIILVARILSCTSQMRFLWATLLLGMAIFPLLLQPDLGTIFLIGMVCFAQYFIAGLPWGWTMAGMGTSLISAISIYCCFPHAAHRIQSFLSTEDPFGSQYQVLRALKGFATGGLWGKGPGAGTVLATLPDGHADFIFSVAGEEFGLWICLFILSLYALIVMRNLQYAFFETDTFHMISILGLALQFGFQMILNVASVLRLIPTKGITLPFISYGGSSFLSLCWSMGILLALTRRYRGFS